MLFRSLAALSGGQAVECEHRQGSLASGVRQRADEHLHGVVAAQGKSAAADLDETGRAGAEHLEAGAGGKPEFGEATDPGGVAGNVVNLGPVTGAKRFEGQGEVEAHGTPRQEGLLRLNLNPSVNETMKMSRG